MHLGPPWPREDVQLGNFGLPENSTFDLEMGWANHGHEYGRKCGFFKRAKVGHDRTTYDIQLCYLFMRKVTCHVFNQQLLFRTTRPDLITRVLFFVFSSTRFRRDTLHKALTFVATFRVDGWVWLPDSTQTKAELC
jgi:hypothetical protein